jgi:hypothetical protein
MLGSMHLLPKRRTHIAVLGSAALGILGNETGFAQI